MLKNRTFLVFIHVFAWSLFLFFSLLAFPKTSALIENDLVQLIVYFGSGIATICFFYFNYYILIPNYLFKHKYILFILFSIIFVAVCIALTRFFLSLDLKTVDPINQSQPFLLPNYIWRFVVVFIVAFAFRFYQKMKQIEAEQISAELATLKAQINPHFLFNTLNGIYGHALTKSDKTAEYILKLSAIMRYTLSETTTEKVALENEINYLKNYIELQKIRLTESTKIDFLVIGEINSQKIPPLLFINFIENAFKYGVSNEVESVIQIHIRVKENTLSLFVKNENMNQNTYSSSYEMGLKNIKRRLDLIFENNYTLEIINNKRTFEVNLMISQK